MDHLFNISVFHSPEDLRSVMGFRGGLAAMGADGLELQTGFTDPPRDLKPLTTSVHLPYAVDWFGPWSGRRPADEGLMGDDLRFRSYGADRDGIAEAVRLSMDCARRMDPAFGVMHAGCGSLDELLCIDYSYGCREVLEAFCEMMNEAVSAYPGGEPPFTLAFENTWWPGFRALDGEGFRLMADRLEFDDWALCIDTGHMLVSAGGAPSEEESLEILNACVDRYPQDMLDRIVSVHLHTGATAGARKSGALSRDECGSIPIQERIARAYRYLGLIDPHRPFATKGAADLVSRMSPDCVVHEMGAVDIADHIRDHICQRSLFGLPGNFY